MRRRLRHFYPFNTEQTINILSEFGPLVTMFVVNAAAGINAGTWALLITTVLAMTVMRMVLGRLPIFPLIASTVTVLFGVMTLITDNPMWVQIKVTIFNALFAGTLFGGLWATQGARRIASGASVAALVGVGAALEAAYLAYTDKITSAVDMLLSGDLSTVGILSGGLVIGFLFGALVIKKNFFEYVFEKTFHYTQEGWDSFTFSFAWFFMFTAVANEAVRQAFPTDETFSIFGYDIDGVNIWILFKICLIMPLSGLYAWYLTRFMHKHRLPEPQHHEMASRAAELGKDAAEFAAATGLSPQPIVVRSMNRNQP